MERLNEWIVFFNERVFWGIPMLLLLSGTGTYLSFRLRIWRLLHPKLLCRVLFERRRTAVSRAKGISPIQAMCTALAGTIGTGNIAGVAGAIAIGGPGAVFWMWVSALLGMGIKFTEIALAVRYREKSENGIVGGPMYTVSNGLGSKFRPLAAAFCVFAVLASFGIGNMVQVHTIASGIRRAMDVFSVPQNGAWLRPEPVIGFAAALLSARVLMGGAKRIGRVTETLVPLMSLLYIGLLLIVIAAHARFLREAARQILIGAFCPKAVAGGGIGLLTTITKGVGRGVFSNEAGLGSAPIAHAASDAKSPAVQGLYGIVEVLFVTLLICTMTAFAILLPAIPHSAGYVIPYGMETGATLTMQAVATVLDTRICSVLLTTALTLFAFSSIFSWGLYGSRCIEFLLGERAVLPYRIVFCVLIVFGASMRIGLVWNVSDLFNALMAIPNLISLLILCKTAVRLTDDAFQSGELK